MPRRAGCRGSAISLPDRPELPPPPLIPAACPWRIAKYKVRAAICSKMAKYNFRSAATADAEANDESEHENDDNGTANDDGDGDNKGAKGHVHML